MSEDPPRTIRHREPDRTVTFERPDGLSDVTDYCFQSGDDNRLTVQYVPSTGGLDPVGVVADFLNQLQQLFPGGVTYEALRPVRRADGQGIELRFVFSRAEDGRSFRQFDLFLLFDDGAGVQLDYVVPEEDAGAGKLFDGVTASLRRAGPDAPAGADIVGGVALSVPEGLRPPQTYQFAPPDADWTVQVRFGDPTEAAAPPEPAGGLLAFRAVPGGDPDLTDTWGGTIRVEGTAASPEDRAEAKGAIENLLKSFRRTR
jgi:hypothetical protein